MMLICENCEQRDTCTKKTRCTLFKEQRKQLQRIGMSITQWEQFEREWQQATDNLRKYFGGTKHGIIHKNSNYRKSS